MSILKVSGIRKRVSPLFTLSDIHFTQDPGQQIAITGETGSGKSTLLKIIAGLVQTDTGTVVFRDQILSGPDDQLIPGHPGIAYLSQDHELRNHYRIEELLDYANAFPEADAERLYRLCRIDHLMKRKNTQLSGGEKQRVALARLLVSAPELLLLDEPFSNLDLIHKNILKSVIADISRELGIHCILSSHDPLDTLSWAHQLIVMRNGAVIQQGPPEHIYLYPDTEYTAALFGAYTLLDTEHAAALGVELPAGKRLLLRPHHISMSAASGTLPALITGIVFLGAWYEINVSAGGTQLTLLTTDRGWQLNQSVFITLHMAKAHIID